MEEDKALDLAKEPVKIIAEKLYDDVAHPALQTVGEIIKVPFDVVDAALTPVKIWVEEKRYNYKRTVQLLCEKLHDVEPEKITAPENYVAIPAFAANCILL